MRVQKHIPAEVVCPDCGAKENKKLGLHRIGDVVSPAPHKPALIYADTTYDSAIVASLDPFILVSKDGKMIWYTTQKSENFEVVGNSHLPELLVALEAVARSAYKRRRSKRLGLVMNTFS